MNELDWKQPALLGGLIAGFLSVTPGIGWANCCFCAWLLVGGAVAAKMLINRTPQQPVKSGQGAQIGAMAGLIASGVHFVLKIPLIILGVEDRIQRRMFEWIAETNSDPNVQRAVSDGLAALELAANMSPAQRIISSLPFLIGVSILFVGFGALGGLLGVALFEKRRDQPPPQPGYPPQYPGQYPPQYPAQYPPQYPAQYSPQYPPSYPQQSAPPAPPVDYPPQNPPQSGGSGGDQGGQADQEGQGGQERQPQG